MRTLLIDNHDSFTYNLFQLLAEVNGEEPIVVRNDEAGWDELARLRFDSVVLSPGPGRPERVGDFGVCAEAVRRAETPLLGVCLGHQGLAWAHGGEVVSAPEPVHGRISEVVHDGAPLFAGIPRRFRAVRYHSLCVRPPLPPALEPIAWSEDGVVMALRHRDRPRWGVQFHPESVCSEHGRRLLENFRDLAETWARRAGGGFSTRRLSATAPHGAVSAGAPTPPRQPLAPPRGTRAKGGGLSLAVRRLEGPHDVERAFAHLYGECPASFWLDSSRVGEGARFSFIGAPGPLGAEISYDVRAREVTVRRPGRTETLPESIFDYLDREIRRLRCEDKGLPFGFNCGFVGYLGYELKADCGAAPGHPAPTPDAAFLFADRVVAFDHERRQTYLLCLHASGEGAAAERWMDQTAKRLASLRWWGEPQAGPVEAAGRGAAAERPESGGTWDPARPGDPLPPGFELSRSRERHLEDIAACKRLLAEGETYEVCLTNKVRAAAPAGSLALYRRLRRLNPAPYSAYLRIGDLAVLSSSPERFLRVGADGRVEAKPIKGTCARGATLAEDARFAERLRADEKSRAENLMIADLLRNDLGRVCEVGSVHVPRLMEVETYETVHQLVTTVRGRLRPGLGPLDCVRACFPPGSMTGAPKERTMEIIDRLEGEARGVYSGALGYIGLGGACDLSVVIRAIVQVGGAAAIGTGGAIVAQSDPEREWEEALLKAWAPMRAIDPAADPPRTSFAKGRRAPLRGGTFWTRIRH